jgi:hypothetical protein
MPYRIARKHIEIGRQHIAVPPPPSHEDLRRVFDRAVGDLYEGERSGAKQLQYGVPIVARRISGITKGDAEKRALTDAARALARLWNV